jgi:hypothetical protein
MRLAERLRRRPSGGRGYHSALVTSFAIEFSAFEEIMLPQLAAAGATNTLLIADPRMSALALTDGSILPQQLGRDYMLHGAAHGAGVFHPKIILQLGRDGGRAFIGSANATAAGMGGNVEIVTEIVCAADPSPEREFVRAVWRYVDNLPANAEGAAREALAWARERAPWLSGPDPESIVALDDGSLLGLLASPGVAGIGERFADLIGSPVQRLIIFSPFWDEQLSGLKGLAEGLGRPPLIILIDRDSHDFPCGPEIMPQASLIDVSGWEKGRFKHAKLILAQTADHDHVLSGSANCTSPALGTVGVNGVNAEACVYRRVPHGEALSALGLEALIRGPSISPADLKRKDASEPLPLGAAHALRPGTFEVEHGELRWTPAGRRWGGRLALLDAEGVELATIEIAAMDEGPGLRSIRLDHLEHAFFARIVDEDVSSTVAPVIHRTLLRSKRREAASRSVATAAAQFVNRGDLQLFLLQALDELERADTDQRSPELRTTTRSSRPEPDELPPKPEFLTYERFVEQRPDARRGAGGHNSLAGSHGDGVRDLLNRLSGALPGPSDDKAGADGDDWMSLGDEDPETVMAKDIAEVEASAPPPADRRAFEKAVKAYELNMRGGSGARPVGSADVLRLRFWLLLLVHAARRRGHERGLPCTLDEFGWPRLALRILAAFFYPKEAPIARLVLEGAYLDLPVDFLETWATAIWILDLLPRVLGRGGGREEFLRRLPDLRARMIKRMGLTQGELEGEAMMRVRDGLEREFGEALVGERPSR